MNPNHIFVLSDMVPRIQHLTSNVRYRIKKIQYLVGADGGDTVDAFAEVRVQRASRHGLKPLQLPRSLQTHTHRTGAQHQKHRKNNKNRNEEGKNTSEKKRSSARRKKYSNTW